MKLTREDKKYYKEFKKPYEGLPYPPIFVTVDAVVQHGKRILLIMRKNPPGKLKLALPGGFVNANERIEAAMWRELKEETGIKYPRNPLDLRIIDQKVIDTVDRSPRGRVITHVFHLYAPTRAALKTRAGDDAEALGWYGITDLNAKCKSFFFEDHYEILTQFFQFLE